VLFADRDSDQGTHFSFRCALESFDSIAHQQMPSSETELSRLVCSRADISRLTYVSEQESACPTTTADDVPENHKVGGT
jgi:centrosomal protein CEP192